MIRVKVPFQVDQYNALEQVDELPLKIKKWLEKVKVANVELCKLKTVQEKHNFIDAKKGLWADDDLKEWLLTLSRDKCWYTEVKHGADYPEIEHGLVS